MASYRVTNNTSHNIWWKDGLWYSGELPPHDTRTQESDHDANVTFWQKINGQDHELGYVWINLGGHLTVNARWDWVLKPRT